MRGYEGFVSKRTISHYKPIARFAGGMEVQVVMPLRLFEIGAIGGCSLEAAPHIHGPKRVFRLTTLRGVRALSRHGQSTSQLSSRAGGGRL